MDSLKFRNQKPSSNGRFASRSWRSLKEQNERTLFDRWFYLVYCRYMSSSPYFCVSSCSYYYDHLTLLRRKGPYLKKGLIFRPQSRKEWAFPVRSHFFSKWKNGGKERRSYPKRWSRRRGSTSSLKAPNFQSFVFNGFYLFCGDFPVLRPPLPSHRVWVISFLTTITKGLLRLSRVAFIKARGSLAFIFAVAREQQQKFALPLLRQAI